MPEKLQRNKRKRVRSVMAEFLQHLIRLFWEKIGLSSVREHVEAVNRAKAGVILALVICLGIGGCAGYSFQAWLSSTLKDQLEKAEQKADTAEKALAPWVLLANSTFTNTPITKRLDALYDRLTANNQLFSELLTGMNAERPTFELSIGGQPLAADSANQLNLKSRDILISAKNLGPITAEGLTISLLVNMDPQLVSAFGWSPQGAASASLLMSDGSVQPTTLPLWTVKSDHLIPADLNFRAPPFGISKAFPAPVLAMQIIVYSEKSTAQRYNATAVLPPD